LGTKLEVPKATRIETPKALREVGNREGAPPLPADWEVWGASSAPSGIWGKF